MDRFRTQSSENLGSGSSGVDLVGFQKGDSAKDMWREIGRGSEGSECRGSPGGSRGGDANAALATAVAATLLTEVFPHILAKLDLHIHDPMTVCAERHGPPMQLSLEIESV